MMQMGYDPAMTEPMRRELTDHGFADLRTAAEVDAFVNAPGTALLVVNSVCGCAAGMARPGARLAATAGVRPDRMGAVFAGVDREAAARARGYFPEIPPSSPSFALLKDGKVVHFIPRHRIENRRAEDVAADLGKAFEAHCAAAAATEGPTPRAPGVAGGGAPSPDVAVTSAASAG